MNSTISRFDGHYFFLSNFDAATVALEGVFYPTVENAFQAAKTMDLRERAPFIKCTPSVAKKLGRRVKLREDWERVKSFVMLDLLRQKFATGTEAAAKLIATGTCHIYEGNTWHDNYWGGCSCGRCQYSDHRNELGILLMRVRRDLTQ